MNLLEGDVGVVEEICVIGVGVFIICNVEVFVSNVCRVGINVDFDMIVKGVNQGVGGVINICEIVVVIQSRGVVEDISYIQSRNNISRVDEDVVFFVMSLMINSIGIMFDLEEEIFKFFNRLVIVGVNVEVEYISGSGVVLSICNSVGVDGMDNFMVDFSEDFSVKDVSEFLFSIQIMNCFQVLCYFDVVFCFQGVSVCCDSYFFD